MSRLVLAAVVVLVAVAAADAVRPKGKEHVRLPAEDVAAAPVVHRASSGYVAVGPLTRNRVLRFGREYLSAASVDAAFPGDDVGEPLDISHLATAPDGTLALAVYRFPAKDPAEAAIELWRRGRLVSAFRVPAGAFGGGLGFAYDGRLVATLLSDGFNVLLFSRTGERAGSASATSW